MKRSALVVWAAGVSGGMWGAAACADVIFDNFGPGNAHLGNTGWSVAWGGPFGAHLEEAVSFTPTSNLYFTQVEIAIGHLWGPNELHVFLHADAGGGGPGAVLDSTVVYDQLLPFPNEPHINNPPVQVHFSGTVQLQAGTKYWVRTSSVTGQDAWLAWNYNTTGDMGERAYRQDGGAWNVFSGQDPRGAFRAHGSTSAPCYANCDGSTTSPVLNVADFSCFLQKFAAQDPYANCDGSCHVLCFTVADFSCFLTKYAAGCP